MRVWMWGLVAGWMLLPLAAVHAQAAEHGLKMYSLSVGVDQRYSLTKSILDTAPRLTFDFRPVSAVRFSMGVSRVFTESRVPNIFHDGVLLEGNHQGTTVSVGVTYKFWEWGKHK